MSSFFISGNKTDSAKILIIALESTGEIGLHRLLAHNIPCHAIYRQCLGTICTRAPWRAIPDLLIEWIALLSMVAASNIMQ